MLRRANKDDIQAMVELVIPYLAESSWSRMEYNRNKTADFLEDLMDDNGFLVVAEREGKIIGGMVGDIVRPWFSDDLMGIEHILYVHPDYRMGRVPYQLIKAWTQWCIDNGAKQIRPMISSGNFAAVRLYQAMGFQTVGGAFLMEVG